MREVFAHDAIVTMSAGGDIGAMGARVTVELCGHWEHEPPCPLAAHHTSAVRGDGMVHLRTLFAAEDQVEPLVRRRIEAALRSGQLVGPTGIRATWQLVDGRPGHVRTQEAAHARRLLGP